MNAESTHSVSLAAPTYHALALVARIDRISPQEIVEHILGSYLEGRLGEIRDARRKWEAAREGRGQVIDLASHRSGRQTDRGNPKTRKRASE
jgi:hypothetical protein